MINPDLSQKVEAFLESGDRSFLQDLLEMDRNNIEGQAVIRYLMNRQHWPLTPESDFATALERLFGEFPERIKRDPVEYIEITSQLIKNSFDYECVVRLPPPPPVEEKKTTRKRKTPQDKRETEEGESGSRVFKSINEVDTQGASERLKKVIEIQRNS